jgi:predicted ATP-binding protein involved in virulence
MRLIMNKNIRELKNKAIKNELLPAYQLFENYEYGNDDVDIDQDMAKKYLEQCVRYLENGSVSDTGVFKFNNKCTLDTLTLFDFRRFQHLQIDFEADLTVLIGGNGQGKTTIANAITKTLSWLTASILKEDGQGQKISNVTDIRNDSEQNFADVVTSLSLGKGLKSIPARLSRVALGTENKRDSDVKELKEIANVWRVINAKNIINLPLFAFYSVERSHPIKKTKKANKESILQRENRFDAYNDALDGAGKFEHFVEWFIGLHKKTANDQSDNVEILQQQINGLKLSVENGVESLAPLLAQTIVQLSDAKSKQASAKEHQTITDVQRKRIVVEAICNVIPSISDIWVETESGSDIIMVQNDDVAVKLGQLSDGQRVFLALVSDLARRLVLLNPKLANPLNGQGIILIDEIELHLHPKWQQDILLDLQNTFPNIQFIVTTHSPQVLSTVHKRCIRQFMSSNHDTITLNSPTFQAKGAISGDILEQLMDVFTAPKRIVESHWVDEFERLTLQEEYELNFKAQELYEKIKSHFGQDSFELKRCDSQVRLQKMKAKVQERILKRVQKK